MRTFRRSLKRPEWDTRRLRRLPTPVPGASPLPKGRGCSSRPSGLAVSAGVSLAAGCGGATAASLCFFLLVSDFHQGPAEPFTPARGAAVAAALSAISGSCGGGRGLGRVGSRARRFPLGQLRDPSPPAAGAGSAAGEVLPTPGSGPRDGRVLRRRPGGHGGRDPRPVERLGSAARLRARLAQAQVTSAPELSRGTRSLPSPLPTPSTLGLLPLRGTRPGARRVLGLLRGGSSRSLARSLPPLPAPPVPCSTGTGGDTDLRARPALRERSPAPPGSAALRCPARRRRRAAAGLCGEAAGACRPRGSPPWAERRPGQPRGRATPAHLPGSRGAEQEGPAPSPRGCREKGRCLLQGDPAVERQGEEEEEEQGASAEVRQRRKNPGLPRVD